MSLIPSQLQFTPFGQLRHLVSLDGMDQMLMTQLLDRAQGFIKPDFGFNSAQTLAEKTVMTAFFEHSTRTAISFTLAAQHLGANTVNFDVASSSTHKGESSHDTLQTLVAMAPDFLVIRHTDAAVLSDALAMLGDLPMAIINAGSGMQAHPSQALLDMLSIRQYKPDFSALTVAIMGDIRHSRVARSQLKALRIMGVPRIHLIAPTALAAVDELTGDDIHWFHRPEEGLIDADVIINLRIQYERLDDLSLSKDDYFQDYGLNPARLALAKPDAIVMHPGPINRNVEIADSIADGPQSIIALQVRNGLAMRMAILQSLNDVVSC